MRTLGIASDERGRTTMDSVADRETEKAKQGLMAGKKAVHSFPAAPRSYAA
jgi:hypothetical protein